MGLITDDLHARLTAALGPEIPVLKPDQVRIPLEAAPTDAQGRPAVGKGERGLGVYLERWPKGYVQLYDASGLISNGVKDTGMVQVECVASNSADAEALQLRVRQTIGSLQVDPTPYTAYLPPTTFRGTGFVRILTTYQINNFGL